MEYIPVSLEEYIAQCTAGGGPDGKCQLVKLCQDLIRNISYFHSKNYVHLDLKMDNIRIEKSGNPIFIDLGVSSQIKTF